MQQIKWFDRKFDFSFNQNIFPSLIERLEGTPILLRHKISKDSPELLEEKPEGTWSIKENIGHLIDIEPLWQGRLEDILNGLEYMRPADLENTLTHSSNHNQNSIDQLLQDFENSRKLTLDPLIGLSEEDIYKSALHPRLNKSMRVMDLYLFVAEHDDHHLARISELIKKTAKG